jgi:hypothetical protein
MKFKYEDFVKGQSIDTHDYKGSAAFFITSDGYQRFTKAVSNSSGGVHVALKDIIPGAMTNFQLDFIIDSIRINNTEVEQLTEYMGDYFNLQFYGRQIPVATITGYISMLRGFDTKKLFMQLYTDLFRVSKVARFGVVPYISYNYPNITTIAGAFLDMNVDRVSEVQDMSSVAFNFLLFKYSVDNIETGNHEVSITYSNLVG